MFIVVVLAGPLLVENDLAAIPDVVVAVVGVIDPVVMMLAGRAQYGRRQSGGQQTGTENARLAIHWLVVLLVSSTLIYEHGVFQFVAGDPCNGWHRCIIFPLHFRRRPSELESRC